MIILPAPEKKKNTTPNCTR